MFASSTGMKVSWGEACTMFNAACPDYDMPGPTFDKYLVSCFLKIHGNTEKRQSQGKVTRGLIRAWSMEKGDLPTGTKILMHFW